MVTPGYKKGQVFPRVASREQRSKVQIEERGPGLAPEFSLQGRSGVGDVIGSHASNNSVLIVTVLYHL